MNDNNMYQQMKEEAVDSIIEALENGYDGYYCDLHNEVFNTNYYVIGREAAKNALREFDVFDAIELVQKYEEEQFGEINTELYDPEKLLNMVWYVIGDEVIGEMNEIEIFSDMWNDQADEETNRIIIEEMRELGI